MVKTKIAVLVSGGGTNLQALLDAQAAGRIPPRGDRVGGLQPGGRLRLGARQKSRGARRGAAGEGL